MKSFCSKVLLFGEYSIIQNSMALCLPYSLFEGGFRFSKKESKKIDGELKAFCQYLFKYEGQLSIDLKSFEFDISQGLTFSSTIPQGFGVGSSGALCAAVYDRYALKRVESIEELKKIFSLMESHFHGASSGIDPLISYRGANLLINEKREIQTVELPHFDNDKGGLFLLNTGRPRRTEPLVNLFLEKCNVLSFENKCRNELIPTTNNCITTFLEGQRESLYNHFRELSYFQFENLSAMIPKLYQDLWREGLRTEKFYLKLCGAGGGGFLMGMTLDFKSAKEKLSPYEIRPIVRL